jgi:hypothetical protein
MVVTSPEIVAWKKAAAGENLSMSAWARGALNEASKKR